MAEKIRGQKKPDIFMLMKYLLNVDLWTVIGGGGGGGEAVLQGHIWLTSWNQLKSSEIH